MAGSGAGAGAAAGATGAGAAAGATGAGAAAAAGVAAPAGAAGAGGSAEVWAPATTGTNKVKPTAHQRIEPPFTASQGDKPTSIAATPTGDASLTSIEAIFHGLLAGGLVGALVHQGLLQRADSLVARRRKLGLLA